MAASANDRPNSAAAKCSNRIAEEVIFSFAFADTAGIAAVGEAFGLGGQ